MKLSMPFLAIAVVGILEAFYHAWLEGAFTTNYSKVSFSGYAAFFGVPYWVFGVVWFPLILVVGLLATKAGRVGLNEELLILLTVGNIFTGYLWYLDLVIIRAFTALYVALYATNYVLTALVVLENRSSEPMRGYVYGTATGAVVGLLFGPYGVAVFGIGGGIFGALRNFVVPVRKPTGS
jgi:uncharacterized membrane protein